MTIGEFMSVSSFDTDELTFSIIKNGKYLYKDGLAKEDLEKILYSKETISDYEIDNIDFITCGDNSGESYLAISFYVY